MAFALDPSVDLDEFLASIPGAKLLDVDPLFLEADPADEFVPLYGDHPPAEWFNSLPDGFGPDSPPYVDELGRVAAVAWPYDRCHIGMTDAGICWTPTPSPTGNHLFHQGTTITAEGISVPTGFLCVAGHDQDPDSTIAEASRWYNDPVHGAARGRILETPEAGYFVGAMRPGQTFGTVEMIRGGALSGDWRWVPEIGAYDALGPCLVGRPGLPTTYRPVAADGTRFEPVVFELGMTAVVASGIVKTEPTWTPVSTKDLAMRKGSKLILPNATRKTASAPVAASPGGLMYRDARDLLDSAVKDRFGSDEVWTWVVDFDDSMLVFESESDGIDKLSIGYTIGEDGTVAFVGEPVGVKTQYVPITAAAPGSKPCSCGGHDVQAAPGDSGGSDDGARISTLEALVSELQAAIARLEAEATTVEDVVPAPSPGE